VEGLISDLFRVDAGDILSFLIASAALGLWFKEKRMSKQDDITIEKLKQMNGRAKPLIEELFAEQVKAKKILDAARALGIEVPEADGGSQDEDSTLSG
jgi:hypothetical protein